MATPDESRQQLIGIALAAALVVVLTVLFMMLGCNAGNSPDVASYPQDYCAAIEEEIESLYPILESLEKRVTALEKKSHTHNPCSKKH
jgi:hypothetical protein